MRVGMIRLALVVLVTAMAALATHGASPNLVRNTNLAKQNGNTLANWAVSGSRIATSYKPKGGPEGRGIREFTVPAGLRAEVSQEVAVSPNKTYFFRAPMQVIGKVHAIIGKRRMVYTGEGKWQTLADLVRTSKEKSLKIIFRLIAPKEGPGVFRMEEVVLRQTKMPALADRTLYGKTLLGETGKNAATIVYPSESAQYKAWAVEIQQALQRSAGVKLPIVSDMEATEKERPVLKKAYGDRHLILLGRLGINRAIWPAYNRFLAAVDGYYPGGEGHVVRTASNVMRNGKNHIIVGGSTEAGSAKAVARFVALLQAKGKKQGKAIQLPWLLDVRLDGQCKKAFLADDAIWTKTPNNAALPKWVPGYQTVTRWYMNAMAYYWTGWDSYKQRTINYADRLIKDDARTHHYIIEFLVRAYDMVDDGGVLSPEQRRGMDRLIAKGFWKFLTGPDLSWMTLFAKPYENIGLRNRHSIAPWSADLFMADFVHDYLNPQGEFAEITAYRRAEKHPVFQNFVANRWQPTLPRLGASHNEEILAALFRYALHNERYDFFQSGNARRALDIENINPIRGRYMDDELIMGILANYYRDGRYLELLNSTPGPLRLFQNRYVCGVRRYTPGPELKPENSVTLCGVRTSPMQPHNKARLAGMQFTMHGPPSVTPDQAFETVALRNGFAPDADYMLLSGLGKFNGAISGFYSLGKRWLMISAGSMFKWGTLQYCDLNAVSILRTDRWIDDPQPYPGAARRDWIANFSESGGVGFTLDSFMTASWQREVVWVRPGLFVIRDRVTAEEDGIYAITVNWRPQGTPFWNGASWTARQSDAYLRLTPLGSDFKVEQNAEAYRKDGTIEPVFKHVLARALKKGQTVTAITVLETSRDLAAFHKADWLGNHGVRLTGKGAESPKQVLFGGLDEGGLISDAKALVVSPRRLAIMGASKCALNGTDLLGGRKSASLLLDGILKNQVVDAGEGRLKSTVLNKALHATLGGLPLELPARKPVAPVVPEQGADTSSFVPKDRLDMFQQTWAYGGMQRPGRIRGTLNQAGDVIDLGKEYRLGEIRAIRRGRFWSISRIPEKIEYASGKEPKTWLPLPGKALWRASISTGNYGQATPIEKAFQQAFPGDIKVRYLRGKGVKALLYYDADRPQARTPLRLIVEDFNKDGTPDILVAPKPWPAFLRNRQTDDSLVAVLDAKGKEMLKHESAYNIQQVRALDIDGSGTKRIFVLSDDARLHIFNPDGSLFRKDDLWAMHGEFNRTKGRPNTRHPAGGYTMPYSVGLWRPDKGGKRRVVVSRYCAYSFLNETGKFEGLFPAWDYVLPNLLPYGVDMDGDGVEEQMCLGKYSLTWLRGNNTPRIPDPNGAQFFPVIYSATRHAVQAPSGGSVDGAPVHIFQTIPFGKRQPRYVMTVRETFVGIFDGRRKGWSFMWTPVVPIQAAALTKVTTLEMQMLVSTGSNMLWKLTWKRSARRVAEFRAKVMPDQVRAMAPMPGEGNRVLIAGDKGLYLLENFTTLTRIAEGSYQAVAPLPMKQGTAIVAITGAGKLVQLSPAP
jgi:hypothetical protein